MDRFNGETVVSAQVVLKQTSRRDYERVKSFFEEAGFTVGPLVANNFAITAPVSRFESSFHTRLEPLPTGGLRAAEGQAPLDLRPEILPAGVRDQVEAIVFTQRPDFGPFNP